VKAAFIEGVYGILPANLDTPTLLKAAESALKGGVQTLQYREKKLGYKRALQRALALRDLTSRFDAKLIINDSMQLAHESHADGVHLGKDDIVDMAHIRQQAKKNGGNDDDFIIGVTCRADAVFAKLALQHGASYVALGAVFGSQTKPEVPVLGLPRLQKARQMFPDAVICAIGGINVENIASIKAMGANSAALISGLFDAPDIEQRAQTLIELWE